MHGRFLLLTFSHEEFACQFQMLTVNGPNQQRPSEEYFPSLLPEINPSLPITFVVTIVSLLTSICIGSAVILNCIGRTIGRLHAGMSSTPVAFLWFK